MGAYAYQSRSHPCPRCLAVLAVPERGGVIRCSCGFERVTGPRDAAPVGRRDPIEETERLRRLAADSDPPYLDGPTAIATAGKETFSAAEAVAIWQRVYATALSRPDDPIAANMLVHFTVGTSSSLTYERGREFTRAAIEATLDHTRDPVARQDMRCVLARGAAREGDLASAEAWLEPCDPRSPVLRADSTYRLARALIDVQRSRPDAALSVLGERPGQVPFSERQSITATLVRAHAHEIAGRNDEAIRLLREHMQQRDPGGHVLFNSFRPGWEPMAICPQTLPLASVEHVRPHLASSQVAAIYGSGFAQTGMALLVAAVVALVAGIVVGQWEVMAIAGLLGPMGGGFFWIGHRRRATEARMLQVRKDGIPALARIASLEHLGPSSGSQAHILIQAELVRAGEPVRKVAFEAMRYSRNRQYCPWIVPHAWLPVRVDPSNPGFVVPDLGA